MIKINTNAAVFETSNCYNYSMIARNYDGELTETFSKCARGSINPEIAEAIELREALREGLKQCYS